MKSAPNDSVSLPAACDVPPAIGTAVVGVGYFGSRHAQCYSRLAGCKLLALVDPDPTTRKLAEHLGVAWRNHVDDLPAAVHAVSVATPLHTHYAVAKSLLERGYDVLLEKPIAETAAQAESLRTLAVVNRCVLQIGHIERFNPAFAVGPALLSRARAIWTVRTTRRAPAMGAPDIVVDLMIHDLDLIRYGVLSHPVALQASGCSHGYSPIDEAHVDLTFANGCRACLRACWGPHVRQEDRCMFVELNKNETWAIDFRQRVAYRTMPGGSRKVGLPCPAHVQRDNLSMEIAAFLAAARHRKVPHVTPEDGQAALGLAEQIRLQILGRLP